VLAAFVADALTLPRSAVTLVSGDWARVKRLQVRGAGVAALLAELVGAQ
jgi:uncharacterized protein YggU (UPF0235/DUF167 family)